MVLAEQLSLLWRFAPSPRLLGITIYLHRPVLFPYSNLGIWQSSMDTYPYSHISIPNTKIGQTHKLA